MDLVEAYYAVAESLRQQGERMLETADMLAGAADRMCEARIRDKSAQPPKSPETACPYGQTDCPGGALCTCGLPKPNDSTGDSNV